MTSQVLKSRSFMARALFRANFRLSLLLIPLVLACGERGADPPPPEAASVASVVDSARADAATSSSAAAPAGGRGDGRGGGQRGKRFGDAPVYLDGKPVGVVRYFELPPALASHPHKLLDGREVRRYRLAEYVETLGVDLAKVKELHIIGGRNRASIISGDELRKHLKDLLFSFSKGTGGKARVHWPESGIDVNTTVDTIVAVSAYVDKDPPRYERDKHVFFYADGTKAEGIPYSKPEESLRGTRVYLDGALAGCVKRKRLPDSVLSKSYTPNNPRFSLDLYMSSVGIDTKSVASIAVLRGDQVTLRLDQKAWNAMRERAEFSLAPGSEGRIIVHLPKGGSETALPASAVLAFSKTKPPKALLDAEIVDVPPPGSEENQAEPDN
jgi:hypothetical protein